MRVHASFRGVILTLILSACGASGPPSSGAPAIVPAQASARPSVSPGAPEREEARETMAADSPKSTASGAIFTVPAGWTFVSHRARSLLDAPESDLHVAILENEEASADAAVAAAWAALRSDFKRPIRIAADRPARNGWDQQRAYGYETSPNERLVISAMARRHGRVWTVSLIESSASTHDRRAAQLRIFENSFYPRGYERESFAGKTVRALDSERIGQLTKFIERARSLSGVPGMAISLVQGGKVVFEGGFGVRELGKRAPVDADTLFMIASNTKALSTLLLAKLIDEGKFDWETPAVRVYPDFALGDAETTRSVRMKHLVCACTGLPRQDHEWFFEYGRATPTSAMAGLAKLQPTTKFGEVFQYSNQMAAAAGFIGGHVAYPKRELGAAYDEAMRTRVFRPLGMNHTTFDFARALGANHASPYAEDVDDQIALVSMAANRSIVPLRPAGGAWTSARDLTRYVQMELANGELPDGTRYISQKSLLARRERQVLAADDASYGMGLETNTKYGIPVVHHGGAVLGYKSDMFWLPEHGVGGVILTNANTGMFVHRIYLRKVLEVLFDGRPEADEELASVLKEYKERRAKDRARLTVPPASDARGALAVSYANPLLGELTVRSKGESLLFDFGEWQSPMASRKNDDGTTSFIGVAPSIRFELVAAEREGKRALVLRDPQHEYVFLEKGAR